MFSKVCRLITPIVILSFLLFVNVGFAKNEESVRAPSPYASVTTTLVVAPMPTPSSTVGAAISPMKQGQKAPFDGVLLSPEAAASVVASIDSIPEIVAVETKKAKDTESAKCNLTIDNLKADIKYEKDSCKTRVDSLNTQVDALNKQIQGYEKDKPNVVMWAGVGFVGGILVTLLTVYAVSQATK